MTLEQYALRVSRSWRAVPQCGPFLLLKRRPEIRGVSYPHLGERPVIVARVDSLGQLRVQTVRQ